MTNRDDFNENVKMILRERVGGVCSNPACRVLTTGPHTNPSKKVSIGIAAHITAAAPGGPRYDASLTSEERKSADNGIWLCSNCASLIDKDESFYTVEVIRGWKKKAEEFQTQKMTNPQYQYHNGFLVFRNVDSSVGIDLWRKLAKNLEIYQSSMDYAYRNWEYNFKDKYPNIHSVLVGEFNDDIMDLQEEIDKFGENLYAPMLQEIHKGFNESSQALSNSITELVLDMSQDLYAKLKEYMSYMDFSYEHDDRVGLVNTYWSMFFVTLDRNYEKMTTLKNDIKSIISVEYANYRNKL